MATTITTSGQASQRIVLTANTQFTLTPGVVDGATICLIFQQDGTGGRTVSFTNVYGFVQPNAAANSSTQQTLVYDVLSGNWTGEGFGSTQDPDYQAAVASGATTITEGLITLGSTGALAMTLALPVAGGAAAGGNDGQVLEFAVITAHAHTVTTPSLGYNGVNHIMTSAGAVGNSFQVKAFGGTWNIIANNGFTLS